MLSILRHYALWRVSQRDTHPHMTWVPGHPGNTWAERTSGCIASYNQGHCIVVAANFPDGRFGMLHIPCQHVAHLCDHLEGATEVYVVSNDAACAAGVIKQRLKCKLFWANKHMKKVGCMIITKQEDGTLDIRYGQQRHPCERNTWLKYLLRIPRCWMRKVKWEEL